MGKGKGVGISVDYGSKVYGCGCSYGNQDALEVKRDDYYQDVFVVRFTFSPPRQTNQGFFGPTVQSGYLVLREDSARELIEKLELALKPPPPREDDF